ncbi:hypothetical protein [Chitinophaga filiformis]|uniref:Uncharacterized protein n=1 Tax=Chitinophaga filiformis TaxID=104663 RepID=A0A1G7NAN1_CHIFI|nr:hypothetical protein [Chitinophaga filiformis]SDF70971.1 hypothetical protein SAMN04488121_102726 [Chitinophaga filiformis]
MITKLLSLRELCNYSLYLIFTIIIFCSCKQTNPKSLDVSKSEDSIIVNKESNSPDDSSNLQNKDLIALITARKEIPNEMLEKHFYFDSTFLSTKDYVYGFSADRYSDSLLLVYIDFIKSSCGERYLITLDSSKLKEIDKLLIATFCDSDQILTDHTVENRFTSDSTFETEDMLYGKGKLLSNGKKANVVYKKSWVITKNGKITLVSSQESEQ